MAYNQREEENILTKKGCKNTRSRKAVIEQLEKFERPVTAEEVYLQIKESGLSINLSTVYRTLDLMESKGLVGKTIMNDNKARYELTGEGHKHHLICTGCHKMIPIDYCPLAKLELDVSKETRFDITGHRLELYGLCPDCKKS
jgi:Fur family ferric uptake transcriptional regulator